MTYIKVPYYDQLNMDDGQGWRDCFSATSAMIAAHYGKVHGENEYNHLRQRYGDSTSAQSQLQALRHLGLDAHYATDGTQKSLCGLLDSGKPVGIGVLHHGPFTSPTGGGHWILAVGYTDTHLVVNDPYGEMDVTNGGYVSNHNGSSQHYSWAHILPRWMVGGTGGWYLYVN
jgi:ABC-type bacteriocin/lantibiotic exporter with double-glycine peptidase domain